jgi:hypothetical protein
MREIRKKKQREGALGRQGGSFLLSKWVGRVELVPAVCPIGSRKETSYLLGAVRLRFLADCPGMVWPGKSL